MFGLKFVVDEELAKIASLVYSLFAIVWAILCKLHWNRRMNSLRFEWFVVSSSLL